MTILRLILVRFSLSGLVNGAVYAAAFLLVSRMLNASSSIASIVGYLAGLAVGFALHRNFTFLADGAWRGQFVRYLAAQALVMTVVAAVSHVASDILHLPTFVVIAAGIVVAPGLTFVLLNYWVFARKTNAAF